MVFENHTAGERAERDAVSARVARIFENGRGIAFRARRIHVHGGIVVNEWIAVAIERASGRRLEWDGGDLFGRRRRVLCGFGRTSLSQLRRC